MNAFHWTPTILMTVALMGTGTPCLAQEVESVPFRVMREIVVPALDREQLIAVPLDHEVYREAQASLADLRIEGPPGKWNAYVVRHRTTLKSDSDDRTTGVIEEVRIARSGERDLEIEYPVRNLQTSENPESHETVVELTTDRTPTSHLEIGVQGRNFSRTAVAESGVERDGTIHWQTIGSATLVHLDFQGQRRENLTISVAPGVYPRLRIRIENRDSPALRVTGVVLRGRAQELVFIGEPEISYRLHYGAPQTAAPEYDIAAIQAALGTRSRSIEATLGPVLPGSTSIDARRSPRRPLWNDPLVLGSSIVILGAVLGIGLVRAGRVVSELPTDDQSSDSPPPPSGSPPG